MKYAAWEHEGTLRDSRTHQPVGHYYRSGRRYWIAEEHPSGKRHETTSRLGAIKVLESILISRHAALTAGKGTPT